MLGESWVNSILLYFFFTITLCSIRQFEPAARKPILIPTQSFIFTKRNNSHPSKQSNPPELLNIILPVKLKTSTVKVYSE